MLPPGPGISMAIAALFRPRRVFLDEILSCEPVKAVITEVLTLLLFGLVV